MAFELESVRNCNFLFEILMSKATQLLPGVPGEKERAL